MHLSTVSFYHIQFCLFIKCIFGITKVEFDVINTRSPPSGDDYFSEKVFELHDGSMTLPEGIQCPDIYSSEFLSICISKLNDA